MKIGYLCPFEDKPMAETETRIRFKYCVQKLGHDFVEINMDGIDLDSKQHADNLKIDFVFSHDTAVSAEKPLPNIFSVFAHWSPNGFLVANDFERYFAWMSKYDIVIGGYESAKIREDVNNHPDIYSNYYNITSSVSKDYIIPPQAVNKAFSLRLFYIGINLEKIQDGNTRYLKLLKVLDRNNKILIYGPNELFGVKNLWEGFNNYKGEIPFDGKTIIKRISEAGIALALNSPVHSLYGTVSNRIYEAAAAGAVIISDDNPYVRKYFKDTVFYIDIKKTEEEQVSDITTILEYIENHRDIAYQMAYAAQEIFVNKLSLDAQVEGLFSFIKEEKQKVYVDYTVDVVCFVEDYKDYQNIIGELERQYCNGLNLIVIASERCFAQIKQNNKFGCHLILNQFSTYGEAVCYIKDNLVSEYLFFMDGRTALHNHHILKLAKSLEKRDCFFAYTGTYLKYIDDHQNTIKYTQISNSPLTDEELFCFLNISCNDENMMFNIEERFSLSCCMFKHEVLNMIEICEMKQINHAVHFYLCCLSIIKSGIKGHFVYAISCGYRLFEGETIQDVFKTRRELNYLYHKSANTFYKDLYLVFFKYDYRVNVLPYRYIGENQILHNRAVRIIKRILPIGVKKRIKSIIKMMRTVYNCYF